jgi:hypothetical protein
MSVSKSIKEKQNYGLEVKNSINNSIYFKENRKQRPMESKFNNGCPGENTSIKFEPYCMLHEKEEAKVLQIHLQGNHLYPYLVSLGACMRERERVIFCK